MSAGLSAAGCILKISFRHATAGGRGGTYTHDVRVTTACHREKCLNRRIITLCALWLFGCTGSGVALAEPYFAVLTGLKCSGCHVNPTGGGLRNTFGAMWGQTALPAKPLAQEGAPWMGELGRHVALGANLRGDATLLDSPGSSSRSSFELTSLRVYLDLRLIPERLSLYVDERMAPGEANNAETYLRLWSTDHRYYVKAGQMYLPSGIRLQDDGAYTRAQSGISFATPDRGVELGFDGRQWTAQLAVSNGTAGAAEVDNGKQWSLRTEYSNGGWRAGASFNLNDFASGSRRLHNLFGGLRTGPVSWLAEIDYIVDSTPAPDRKQLAGLVEANWRLRQGHNLKLAAEAFDPDRSTGRDRQTRMSVVWEYTPLPFLQLRTGLRNYDDVQGVPFFNQRMAFIQLHGFF
jgi:hypothetical protein